MEKSFHNGTGIIDGVQFPKRIPVIPLLHFFKIAAMVITEFFYFIGSKSDASSKLSWLDHGIFPKIRYGRLGAVFFNGQDSCHICCRKYFTCHSAVFEQGTQEFEIFFLQVRMSLCLPDRGVPFVNNHDKFISRYFGCIGEGCRKAFRNFQCRILFCQFPNYISPDIRNHISHRSFSDYSCHIQINHIVLIQVFSILCVTGDCQMSKSIAELQVLS